MKLNSKTVAWILLIVTILGGGFYINHQNKSHKYLKEVSDQEIKDKDAELGELIVENDRLSAMFFVNDSSRSEVVYKTIYKAPDGYVKFDIAKYQRSVNRLNQLRDDLKFTQKKYRELQKKLESIHKEKTKKQI